MNVTSSPLISVLMPVYNTPEKYLRPAIESVLNQTFGDFELLVADDCSPDARVREIMREYADRDKRVRCFFNKKNLKCGLTCNMLLGEARGELIARMDADDTCDVRRFEKQVDYLKAHPEVDFLATWFRLMDSSKITKTPETDREIKRALCLNNCIGHPTVMIRHKLLMDNNICYSAEFPRTEDYALWAQVMRYATMACLPEVLYNYRTYNENTSNLYHQEQVCDSAIIKQRIRRENPDIWKEVEPRCTCTTRYRLFGLIPFLTIRRRGFTTECRLFSCIPLYTSRLKETL